MRQLLKKVLKSKVVENGVWLYALQIFSTLAPLLTVPYIVRVLESAQYGVFSMSLNIIGYLQVIVEYGFAMSATRKVALDGNQEKINKMFTTILFARMILFVFSLILALSYIVRRHIVGGANRTLISAITSLRSCGIGTCCRLSSG